jgi:cell wall-associated NlpC family hydrolase/cell division protein FtsB
MRHPSAPELSPRLVVPGLDHAARPKSPVRRLHRLTATVLAVGLVAGITLAGGGAGAQTVESLRARAQQLADELDELEQQSSELNEQYLELSNELEELEAEQATNRRSVDEAQARVDATRSEAADYLVEAYIGAGSSDGIALGSSDPNEAVNSQVMLEILRSDRELAADEYAVSKSDLEARAAALDASSKELSAAKDRQARIVADLQSSVDRHDELLASTNSQLDQALAAERERREAAAAERAQAAARQQAAAAAASTPATTAAPRAASPGRASSGGNAAPAPAAAAPAPAPAPAPIPVSAPNGRASAAIAAAMSRLGTPYRWGGTTPAGFDCSGLMLWSWAQAGVSLPRTSGAQRAYTQRISAAQLQPGDLVFTGNPVYHVGMYIGGGQMIHSPHTGDVVKVSAVRSGGSVSYGRIP